MSSPKVLTTSPAPRDVCMAANRETCEEYIAKCEAAWVALNRRSDKLKALGVEVDRPRIESMETAIERTWMKYHQNPAFADANGVAYIFDYHQRLKHPWIERLDEAELEEMRVRAELAASQKELAMSAQMRETIDAAAANVGVLAAEYAALASREQEVTRSKAKVEVLDALTFASRAKTAIDGIIASASDTAEAELLRQKVGEITSGEAPLVLIRLEEMLFQRRHEASRARESTIAAEMCRRNVARLKEEMQLSVEKAKHLLAAVGVGPAREFEARFAQCHALADQGKLLEAENLFGVTREELTKQATARPVVLEIIRELKLRGYSDAPEMETITAGDFTTAHLTMKGDEDRVVEVRCSSRTGAVSFEVCRLQDANGTASQRSADEGAQRRFCGDLNEILSTKVKTDAVQVLKDEAPGKAMKSRRIVESANTAAAAEDAAAAGQSMSLPSP